MAGAPLPAGPKGSTLPGAFGSWLSLGTDAAPAGMAGESTTFGSVFASVSFGCGPGSGPPPVTGVAAPCESIDLDPDPCKSRAFAAFCPFSDFFFPADPASCAAPVSAAETPGGETAGKGEGATPGGPVWSPASVFSPAPTGVGAPVLPLPVRDGGGVLLRGVSPEGDGLPTLFSAPAAPPDSDSSDLFGPAGAGSPEGVWGPPSGCSIPLFVP